MFAVVRIRGTIGLRKGPSDTLKMMRLRVANNCVLLPEKADVKGMLQKSKDYITWGTISKETLAKMLEKRLRTAQGNNKTDVGFIKENLKIDSFDALAQSLIDGKTILQKEKSLKPILRLTPPSKGFKFIKQGRPQGDLGYRKEGMDSLLKRMI